MKVRAVFHGILSEWMGTRVVSLELPSKASLVELLGQIRVMFGDRMPHQLWDSQRGNFAQQVLATRDGQPLRDPCAPLEDGQEIHFFLLLAGG
jgi:molybdopterin converting factor small subunit